MSHNLEVAEQEGRGPHWSDISRSRRIRNKSCSRNLLPTARISHPFEHQGTNYRFFASLLRPHCVSAGTYFSFDDRTPGWGLGAGWVVTESGKNGKYKGIR